MEIFKEKCINNLRMYESQECEIISESYIESTVTNNLFAFILCKIINKPYVYVHNFTYNKADDKFIHDACMMTEDMIEALKNLHKQD